MAEVGGGLSGSKTTIEDDPLHVDLPEGEPGQEVVAAKHRGVEAAGCHGR